jgi:hypothetical protein
MPYRCRTFLLQLLQLRIQSHPLGDADPSRSKSTYAITLPTRNSEEAIFCFHTLCGIILIKSD